MLILISISSKDILWRTGKIGTFSDDSKINLSPLKCSLKKRKKLKWSVESEGNVVMFSQFPWSRIIDIKHPLIITIVHCHPGLICVTNNMVRVMYVTYKNELLNTADYNFWDIPLSVSLSSSSSFPWESPSTTFRQALEGPTWETQASDQPRFLASEEVRSTHNPVNKFGSRFSSPIAALR